MGDKPNTEFKSFGGFRRGLSSDTDHILPHGYVKQIDEFRPVLKGLKTRLGWNTVLQGLDSASWPGSGSGGWDNTAYGREIGYINSDSGKVKIFEKGGICDSATGAKFETATSSLIGAAASGEDFRGVVWFASQFLVYTADYLYQVNIADGTLTQKVRFSTQLGSKFSPVLKMIPRYGQLWVISVKDTIFWGDTREFTIGTGTSHTEIPLNKAWAVWQSLEFGPITSVDQVEALFYSTAALFPTDGFAIIDGVDYCFVEGGNLGRFAVGDKWFPTKNENSWSPAQIKTSGISFANVRITENVSAGASIVKISESSFSTTDKASQTFLSGTSKSNTSVSNLVTISDGSNSETVAIKRVNRLSTSLELILIEPLVNSYAVITPTTVTHTDAIKLEFTSNFDYGVSASLNEAHFNKEIWQVLTLNTDYIVDLDPEENVNADGNVKLLETSRVKGCRAIRCDYTDIDNDWFQGSAGRVEINPSKGNNVAIAEGPDYSEVEGASTLYIFKDDGGVYSILGKSGIQGDVNTLDVRFVGADIPARPLSIRTTNGGIIYGGFDGIEYKCKYIPHFKFNLKKFPDITDEYMFDKNIPFDNTNTYTFYEVSGVAHGDLYLISFPYSSSGLPTSNGYIYACDVYFDSEEDIFKGRWFRWKESNEMEHEVNTSDDIVSAPITTAFYKHYGALYRTYYIKTGHNFAGVTRYYEIARQGFHAGSEEVKDDLLMTRDDGAGSHTTINATDYLTPELKSGMIKWGENFSLERILFFIDCVGGSAGDGIDFTFVFYKDLETAVAEATFTKEDITDTAGALNLLIEKEMNVDCRYLQVYFKFNNIKYSTHPAYILIKDVVAEVRPLEKRLTTEEDF